MFPFIFPTETRGCIWHSSRTVIALWFQNQKIFHPWGTELSDFSVRARRTAFSKTEELANAIISLLSSPCSLNINTGGCHIWVYIKLANAFRQPRPGDFDTLHNPTFQAHPSWFQWLHLKCLGSKMNVSGLPSQGPRWHCHLHGTDPGQRPMA